MSKIKKLAQLNKVITRLEDLGMQKEADSIHREFIKISQEDDARQILRMIVARGMGLLLRSVGCAIEIQGCQ